MSEEPVHGQEPKEVIIPVVGEKQHPRWGKIVLTMIVFVAMMSVLDYYRHRTPDNFNTLVASLRINGTEFVESINNDILAPVVFLKSVGITPEAALLEKVDAELKTVNLGRRHINTELKKIIAAQLELYCQEKGIEPKDFLKRLNKNDAAWTEFETIICSAGSMLRVMPEQSPELYAQWRQAQENVIALTSAAYPSLKGLFSADDFLTYSRAQAINTFANTTRQQLIHALMATITEQIDPTDDDALRQEQLHVALTFCAQQMCDSELIADLRNVPSDCGMTDSEIVDMVYCGCTPDGIDITLGEKIDEVLTRHGGTEMYHDLIIRLNIMAQNPEKP